MFNPFLLCYPSSDFTSAQFRSDVQHFPAYFLTTHTEGAWPCCSCVGGERNDKLGPISRGVFSDDASLRGLKAGLEIEDSLKSLWEVTEPAFIPKKVAHWAHTPTVEVSLGLCTFGLAHERLGRLSWLTWCMLPVHMNGHYANGFTTQCSWGTVYSPHL